MDRVRTYVVEAQRIFVPYLTEVLADAGLEIVHVAGSADIRHLMSMQPHIVFIDLDFVESEPLELISVVRSILPEARICVYTDVTNPAWSDSCHFAGAHAVISKAARADEFAPGLRAVLETGTYTDPRFNTTSG